MTVRELIDRLEKIEDKEREVYIPNNMDYSPDYDRAEMVRLGGDFTVVIE